MEGENRRDVTDVREHVRLLALGIAQGRAQPIVEDRLLIRQDVITIAQVIVCITAKILVAVQLLPEIKRRDVIKDIVRLANVCRTIS